jgi:hypothetical protein
MVAAPDSPTNTALLHGVLAGRTSSFISTDFIF